jgi:vacuolar protein sorting-associated protein IST1
VKLKVMKEIAKEHQIEWDTEESEKELLKAPEEMIVSSSLSLSLSHTHTHKKLNLMFLIKI